MFDNKVLMITGGTGSFGNTVLKRFLQQELASGPVTLSGRDTAAPLPHGALA